MRGEGYVVRVRGKGEAGSGRGDRFGIRVRRDRCKGGVFCCGV